MPEKVIVNNKQCELIAQKILPLKFRKEHFNRPFLNFKASGEKKMIAYLFAAAICHQTHTLINKKKNLKGWSFIEDVFMNLGVTDSELLIPKFIISLSKDKLIGQLKVLFADDGNPANCTLDRLEQRADFMIQISRVLVEKYNGKISNLLNKTNGFILGENGLYELFADFKAFTDPLRKKSTVFVQFVTGSKLFQFKDLELMEPVMDYHMQRLLLRTGCIEVLDEILKQSLQNQDKLPSDKEVREASVEAVKVLSKLSKKNYFEIDEVLWSLGRSCCKEKTLCYDEECNKKPCTFHNFMDIKNHDHCVFEGICIGGGDIEYRKYWQPNVDTHYY